MHLLECQSLLIFQKGPVEINFLDRFQTLHLSWSDRVYRDDYLFVMDQLHRFTLKLKVYNWLIDAREADWVEMGDAEWLGNYYEDKIANSGLKKIGRLASGNFFFETQLSSQITNLKIKGKFLFDFKYFQDINAALDWFRPDCPTCD